MIDKPDLYQCHLEWGYAGIPPAVDRRDVLVIIDTLSFSTSVVTGVHNQGVIQPLPDLEDFDQHGLAADIEVAVHRHEVPDKGQFSLSPLTYDRDLTGQTIVLWSLNGGTCCLMDRNASAVIVGALVNATAVAGTIRLLINSGRAVGVTILACGEHYPDPKKARETLRFAIEDYLGTGAILAGLDIDKSPEAVVCERAYLQSKHDLTSLIWHSTSGRELRDMGFPDDVRFATRIDRYNTVPVLHNSTLCKYKNT